MSLFLEIWRAAKWVGGWFYREDHDDYLISTRAKREEARLIATGDDGDPIRGRVEGRGRPG